MYKNHIHKKFGVFTIIVITILIISSNIFLIIPKQTPNKDKQLLTQEDEIKQNLRNMKGFFTKNQGQFENDEIYFTYSGNNINFGFLESSVLIKLSKELEENITKSSIVKITFENSNKVIPKGIDELNHKSNYFIGNDSTKWKNNVPNYEKIVYESLYDGIDLVYYFNDLGLKYDWVVKAGADPSEIVERFEEIDSLKIDSDGGLIIKTEAGELKEEKPYCYQEIDEDIIEVNVSFRFVGNKNIAYDIGNFDSSKDLIIDPLIYSTFIGGCDTDIGSDLIQDTENNAYITGKTYSSDFPTTTGCFDVSHDGKTEVFLLKLSSEGSSLIYSTFMGGSDIDSGNDIALDSENNVYLTGETSSLDFPTTFGCFDDSYNGGKNDGFITKFNSNCSTLIFSSFIGGNSSEHGYDVELDSENNAYIAGLTYSSVFPTTSGCFDDSYNGKWDVFVLKLNQNGSDLLYSTYVGGSNADIQGEIVLDLDNHIYVSGYTNSLDFPTTSGCFDDSYNGGYKGDVFVFKLNQDGTSLLYSTYVGGNDSDIGSGITLDTENNAYITGRTSSLDFPVTPDCFADSYNGGDYGDIFVFKLNSNGSSLLYSTFIGGDDNDHGYNIILDSENNAYVIGETLSLNFPTTPGCFDNSYNGGYYDVFVFKLNSKGSNLLYSTFIGGTKGDSGGSIALDSDNNVYIRGNTMSYHFPVTPCCFDDSYNGGKHGWGNDVFILKLDINLKSFLNLTIPSDGISVNETDKTITIKGNASVSDGNISKVQIKLDKGKWQDVEGTTDWIYNWDLKDIKRGKHTISIRSLDGCSCLNFVTIEVNIIGEKNDICMFTSLIIIIVFFILLLLLFTVNLWYGAIEKRKIKKVKAKEEKQIENEIKEEKRIR